MLSEKDSREPPASELSGFLSARFNEESLPRFIKRFEWGESVLRELSGASFAAKTDKLVELLQQFRVIDDEFFRRLAKERPRCTAEIVALAGRWGVEVVGEPPASPPALAVPSSRRRGMLAVLGLGLVVAAGVTAYALMPSLGAEPESTPSPPDTPGPIVAPPASSPEFSATEIVAKPTSETVTGRGPGADPKCTEQTSWYPLPTARADCPATARCGRVKPNLLLILDYSSSLNTEIAPKTTRWGALAGAVRGMLERDEHFVDDNFNVSLMRFGHDPGPASPGTPIMLDTSGLVDGVRVDVPWRTDGGGVEGCRAREIVLQLRSLPSPMCGGIGIGTWTRGGLEEAESRVARNHWMSADEAERPGAIVLFTDGAWTSRNGQQILAPKADDPEPVARRLFEKYKVRVFVVALVVKEEPAGSSVLAKAAATDLVEERMDYMHELAKAAGTDKAYAVRTPEELAAALRDIVARMKALWLPDSCEPGTRTPG